MLQLQLVSGHDSKESGSSYAIIHNDDQIIYFPNANMTDFDIPGRTLINNYLMSITKGDCLALYEMYRECQMIVEHRIPQIPAAKANAVSKLIHNVISKEDLYSSLTYMVQPQDVTYPECAFAKESFDSGDELGFYIDDYIDLTALCVLSKLLHPVLGTIAFRSSVGMHLALSDAFVGKLIESWVTRTPFDKVYYKLTTMLEIIVEDTRDCFDVFQLQTGRDLCSQTCLSKANVTNQSLVNYVIFTTMTRVMSMYDPNKTPDIVKYVAYHAHRDARVLLRMIAHRVGAA